MEKSQEIKIAYIGGGSRYWARTIMTDLALCPYLRGQIALYDIDHDAALVNVKTGNTIFRHPDAKTKFRVSASKSLKQTLQNSDFIILSILPGAMQCFANDIDIPLEYGILQTVGDTTGPGGISRALRTIPIYEQYAHAIMKHSPHAWVINYTNPMTLCTAALYDAEPDIKAFGCCHEVFHAQGRLASLVQEHHGVPKPHRTDIKTDITGVNHFTFATRAQWQGMDLFPLLKKRLRSKEARTDHTPWSLERRDRADFFGSKGLIGLDFYKNFGVFGAAGDRHLAEFVPWYLTSEENIHRYGVLLTPSSHRLGTWKPPQNAPALETKKKNAKRDRLQSSGEEGVDQMMALCGIKPLDTNVNIPNIGQMPNMPTGAIVETNAQFRHNSLTPLAPKPLPHAVSMLVGRIVGVQQMTLQAARERKLSLAFQALLNDPLCRLPTDTAFKMFKKMVRANKDMLKEYPSRSL